MSRSFDGGPRRAATDTAEPANIYRVIETIPGDALFTPAAKSGCPFTAG